jgi:D-sedoheptulose 7-phosphate isomerase
MESFFDYAKKLNDHLQQVDIDKVELLYNKLRECWHKKNNLFFCGNGGSAGNANHLANDFIYGVAKKSGCGFKVHSLSSNSSVITCLANDIGYANVFSEQLLTLGSAGDLLICLSGSGNSKNILNAINAAKEKKIHSFSILGYGGGEALSISDDYIRVPINDMQISEDFQLILFHHLMQRLYQEYSNG